LPEAQPVARPRIYDIALEEVFAGSATPDDAKTRELTRLRQLASERGWSLGFVAKEFEKLFGARPTFGDCSDAERQRELASLRAVAQKKGYKAGWVAYRYKHIFGVWPPRA